MSHPRDHKIANKYAAESDDGGYRYEDGVEVLGLSVGDFVPWLGAVGGIASGLLGGGGGAPAEKKAGPDPMMQMMMLQQMQQQQREAKERKAASDRNTIIAVSAVGLAAVGGLFFLLKK